MPRVVAGVWPTCALLLLTGTIAHAAPRTWTVAAGGDVQAALNAAQPGDTILLQAGVTFVGNFVLPVKTGSEHVTLRSGAPDSALPGTNVRMTPAYASLLPKLRSPNSMPVLSTAPGAHHYQLMQLEFLSNAQGLGDMLALGDGSAAQSSLTMVPHDLIVDRVYMHGDPVVGQKRAIALNSAATTISNSHIANIKAVGQDSQAIAGWNGPGPYLISNNFLEAASENVCFGGTDPSILNLVPSDITFTRNHLSKQLVWRTEGKWNVKNLFELKTGRRVLIDGNLMENNWLEAQAGYAILFTPRNQEGAAPWTVIEQVQFTNNHVRHVSAGFNILGHDYTHPSRETNSIVIRNNLFEDVSRATFGGSGMFVLVNGGQNITIDHNTVMQDGTSAIYGDTNPSLGFVLTNNIVRDNSWAIMGGNTSPGNGTIAYYFPGSQILKGIYVGSNPATYPPNNFYPATLDQVGFVDWRTGNYRLLPSSPYRGAATDGTDVGVNIDALSAAFGTLKSPQNVTIRPSAH